MAIHEHSPQRLVSQRWTPALDRLPQALSLAVHELRTPLAVVSGYLRMVLHDTAGTLTDQQRAMLGAAQTSCAHLTTLVVDMSALGHLEAGEATVGRVAFDMAALLDEVASDVVAADAGEIRLDVRAPRPVMVAGDRTRLAAALRALMRAAGPGRNAPDAIVVECSTIPDVDQTWAVVTIGTEAVTGSLVGTAHDHSSFDEWRGGLGFALPIARRVIEAHGGDVWSAPDSVRHAGSALRLPVAGSVPGDAVVAPGEDSSS